MRYHKRAIFCGGLDAQSDELEFDGGDKGEQVSRLAGGLDVGVCEPDSVEGVEEGEEVEGGY